MTSNSNLVAAVLRGLVAVTVSMSTWTFGRAVQAAETGKTGLDAPIVSRLNKKFVKSRLSYYARIFEVFTVVAPRLLGKPLAEVTVREVLRRKFSLHFHLQTPREKSDDFEALLAEVGLPSEMTESELSFFEAHPNHPLFTPLKNVPMPKRWTPYTLAKSYRLHFVIDAVRAIKRGTRIKNRNGFDQFRKSVEDYLGQSIESFVLNSHGHLDLEAAAQAMVTGPAPDLRPKNDGAGQSVLDTLAAEVLWRDVRPARLWDKYDDMVKLADSRHGAFTNALVRDVITHEFVRNLRYVRHKDVAEFKRLFAAAGLPADLSEYELRLFEANSKDPLFESIDKVKLPPRFSKLVLGKVYGVFFVIDAVRELGPAGRLSSRLGAAQFREAIGEAMGRPFESIKVDRTGHLAIIEPVSVSEKIFVLPPDSTCAVPLEALPNDVLKREVERRERLGIY